MTVKKQNPHKHHLHARIHHKIKKNLAWVKKKLEGFTLIELLIVIAVIGILASIVLASLNSARMKGADAGIKSSLSNMRTQASLWYDDNGQVYATGTGTVFPLGQCSIDGLTGNIFADPKIYSAITAAYGLSGGVANSLCVALTNSWAVAVQLKTSDGYMGPNPDAWCVDSLGSSKSIKYPIGAQISSSINVDACR